MRLWQVGVQLLESRRGIGWAQFCMSGALTLIGSVGDEQGAICCVRRSYVPTPNKSGYPGLVQSHLSGLRCGSVFRSMGRKKVFEADQNCDILSST